MELYHLRTFVTVAEEAHLTRAAERLFTSQPAISAQLRALEDELGVALFDRTPRGMQLTEPGRRLLEHARRTLAAADELRQHAGELKGEIVGAVRIGLNSDAAFLRIVELQALLARRHPRLTVEYVDGSTIANLPALRTGRLDAAFISGQCEDDALHAPALCDQALVVAVPESLRTQASPDVAILARLPWIHTSPDCAYYLAMCTLFEAHCCEPAKVVMSGHEDAVDAMMRAGLGLAIMRRERAEAAAADGLATILPIDLPPVALRLAYPARRANDPMLRAVVGAVAEVWALGDEALQETA